MQEVGILCCYLDSHSLKTSSLPFYALNALTSMDLNAVICTFLNQVRSQKGTVSDFVEPCAFEVGMQKSCWCTFLQQDRDGDLDVESWRGCV